MIININPAAEASVSFEAVKAGKYFMRIKGVEDRNNTVSKNDLKVDLVHVVPAAELVGITGEPLKGQPQMISDYVMLAEDKQWKLRAVTEAAGLPWADYDPVVDLVGREVEVSIKNEVYEGEQKNKIGRYLVPKQD